MKDYIAAVKWTGNTLDKYKDFDIESDADNHVANFGGFVAANPGGSFIYWIIDGVAKTITVDNASNLSDSATLKKSNIDAALVSRLNQGIVWQWNGGGTQYSIPLDMTTQTFLRTLDSQFVRNRLNPHDGYLQFNGERLLALGGGALPDDAVEEILDFSSQWGLKVSRIAIDEKTAIDEMAEALDLAGILTYDASSIDWSVTWIGHTDWIDDVVSYIPNV